MQDEIDQKLLRDIEDARLESSLLAYLGFISNIAILEPEEVEELMAVMRDPARTEEERLAAREKLVLANTRLVINIARQYYHTGIHLMDLISEGTIGLMVAVEKFDPKKGFRLSTYATWWIRQRILRYIVNNQYLIRVPEHVIDKINRLNRASVRLRATLERDPTVEELAEETGLTLEDIEKYAASLPSIYSLEESFESSDKDDSRGQGMHERIGSGEDIIMHVLNRKAVSQMMKLLDDKEKLVIRLRYGLSDDQDPLAPVSEESQTLEQIAQSMGVSRERVRQIERIALQKIKKRFLRHQ